MCWRHDVPYILWLLAGGVVCRAVGLCWLGNILIPDGFCSGRCNPIVTEFRATDRPVLITENVVWFLASVLNVGWLSALGVVIPASLVPFLRMAKCFGLEVLDFRYFGGSCRCLCIFFQGAVCFQIEVVHL